MNKLFLKFAVQGMKLSRTNVPPIVDGSRKYIHAGFVFSADWDGCDKFVLVARNNETYTYLITDGEAEIPVDVIRTAGSFDLTVFGVNGDVKITTNSVSVTIGSTEFHDNPAGEETRLTGDFLTDTLKAVKEYSEDAETSATNASTASQQSNFHADRASNEATRAKTNADNAKQYADNAKQYADDAKNYSENVNVFIPAVSSDGVISWTNEKGLDNPAPVNIRGPIGLTGPQGLVGPVGPAGKDGVIPEEQLAQINANTENIIAQSGEIVRLKNSKIDDVKINGVSVVTDKVANIPVASYGRLGVVKSEPSLGLNMTSNNLFIVSASNALIDGKVENYRPIVPAKLDYAVKSGLADSKIEWTDTEKANARQRLGVAIVTLTQAEYDALEIKSPDTTYLVTESD